MADVAKVQNTLVREGMETASVNQVTHSVFFALLRDLSAIGKVRPMILARVHFAPQLAAEPKIGRPYYTANERDTAIGTFAGHRAHPLVAFLFLSAVRRGEASALLRRKINWQLRSAAIDQTHSNTGGLTPGKRPKSRRTIFLGDEAFDAILPLKAGDPDAPLFLSPRGKRVNMDTFADREWHPMLKTAGLPYLSLHGTRHTWAYNARLLGLTVEEVAAQLGDTVETVREFYDHVVPRFDPNSAIRPSPPPVTQVVAERRVSYLRLVKG